MLPEAQQLWWKIGGISAALAVTTGAFGAHGLRNRVQDPRKIETWETGSRYHLIHALALFLVPFARRNHNMAGALMLGGQVLFSGSLYGIVLTDQKKLGMVAPIGGSMLIAGWMYLGLACL
eukprot:gb/GECH01011938.1/.p1 GENE.gb/GECH01011938.1/~~gb/GECH01011938.1/.p1  ORF type:complete len:121 (+),score=21.56 gb/GECH01011938.1/:1-363(+)